MFLLVLDVDCSPQRRERHGSDEALHRRVVPVGLDFALGEKKALHRRIVPVDQDNETIAVPPVSIRRGWLLPDTAVCAYYLKVAQTSGSGSLRVTVLTESYLIRKFAVVVARFADLFITNRQRSGGEEIAEHLRETSSRHGEQALRRC